jgi:hypothetical protein
MIAWLDVPGKTHNQRSPPIAQIAYFHFYRVKLIELGVDAVDHAVRATGRANRLRNATASSEFAPTSIVPKPLNSQQTDASRWIGHWSAPAT